MKGEKELLKKQELVLQLGMEFDEVANIFSEETLNSMVMSHTIGGNGDTNVNCPDWNFGECGCPDTNSGNCVCTNISCPTTNYLSAMGCDVTTNVAGCPVNTNEYFCGCIPISVSIPFPIPK